VPDSLSWDLSIGRTGSKGASSVIPAKAGIQPDQTFLGSRLRWSDSFHAFSQLIQEISRRTTPWELLSPAFV
jgi:hypothetical protein